MLEGFLLVIKGQQGAGKAVFDKASNSLTSEGFVFMGPTFRALFTLAICKRSAGLPEPQQLAAFETELMNGERWLLPQIQKLMAVTKTRRSNL